MDYGKEKAGFYAALMFFVWPLLAVTSAFRNYRSSWGRNILWAFVAFYGFVFAIGMESQGSDINRYIEELKYLHSIEMTIPDAVQYFRQSGEVDILRTFIAVTLSRFTGSQAVLTLVFGVIFGFFFSRNMWYVLTRLEGKIKLITILLFACFFLVIPIWNINGFRMWTAAHVFIYGLLPFLLDGKRWGLFVSTLSVLIHFSFIVPLGILFTYLLIGNRVTVYFCFFVATMFISEINLDVFNRVVENYAPEIVQERTSSYRSEQKVEEFRESSNSKNVWYAVWYGRALRWSIMGFLIILFLKGRSFFLENKHWLSLFSFTLLFYGASNLLNSLPSGGRFLNIGNILALALIILYIQNRKQEVVMERFVWIATPALLLYIVVALRTGLYSMSATAILGNPILAFFMAGENISLNDVMKMIL